MCARRVVLLLWRPDAHDSARERKWPRCSEKLKKTKKKKHVSSRWRPWERKYNTLARSALTVFPYAPRKLDETERGRVANPQALLTLWSVTASREAGEKKGKSAHSQLLTRTDWRFLWGSVVFFVFSFLFFWSPPFYNCAYFPLWIMCFGFE